MKMGDSIFKKRLITAKDSSQKIKLMFQYPGSPRAIKKSGEVLDIADDGFTIDETIDGQSTYSYTFLVEVSDDNDGEPKYGGQQNGQQQARRHNTTNC